MKFLFHTVILGQVVYVHNILNLADTMRSFLIESLDNIEFFRNALWLVSGKILQGINIE